MDGPPYYVTHIHQLQTLTNTANGSYVTAEDRVTEKDLKITDNGDGTVTVLVLATGTAQIRDGDGRLLGANPGQVRFELVIDAEGNQVGELVVVKGSTGRNDDFCSVVVPAIS